MRITCPNCTASFEIPTELLGKKGRSLKCASCGHSWYQTPHVETIDLAEIMGQEYAARANWKLLVENSYDGYHAMTTHASYLDYLRSTVGSLSRTPIDGIARDLGNGHAVVEYTAPWGRPVASWIPMWGEEGRREIDFRWRDRRIHWHLVGEGSVQAKAGEQRARLLVQRQRVESLQDVAEQHEPEVCFGRNDAKG